MKRPVDRDQPTELVRCNKSGLFQGTYPIWICDNQTTHESGYCFKHRPATEKRS